jgi:hypothetical protein
MHCRENKPPLLTAQNTGGKPGLERRARSMFRRQKGPQPWGCTMESNRSKNLKLSEAGVPSRPESSERAAPTRYSWLSFFRLTHE